MGNELQFSERIMKVFSDQCLDASGAPKPTQLTAASSARRLTIFSAVIACSCLLLGSLSSQLEAATVRAYVQPESARPNQVINYVITVQDGQVQSLPNLRFPLQIGQTSGVSTSQQVSIVNGRQSVSLQLSWGITATEPGEFVIPTQTIIVDGQPVTTNEVKLTVGQGEALTNGQPGEDKNTPILQIELPKKEIYQGEVVPVTCVLYVPRQTQLRRVGLIEIEKSDFAIARFPQTNDQTSTIIDGQSYYVLSYRSTLSSLRTGDLKVGPANLEMLIEVPMEGQQRQILPPGFPQGFFGTVSEPRKMEVKSQQVTLRVLPLPTEGKPANFSGAVGEFQMTATATPTELTVGDPVSVEIAVSGAGNFDALNTPSLVSTGGWKLYPAKRYNIEGQIDQNQTPTLERRVGYSQVMVPEAVHNEVPPFELTYFNPTDKKYVTLRTAAIPVNMKPAAAVAGVEAASTGAAVLAEVAPLVTAPQPNITDILIKPAALSNWAKPSYTTLMQSRAFWSAQAVPVFLFGLACCLAIVKRRQADAKAGKVAELRAVWKDISTAEASDQDFLRRAAQFIQTVQPSVPSSDVQLKGILDRYAMTNFTAGKPEPISGEEKSSMLKVLESLFQQSLKKLSLVIVALSCLSLVNAQTPAAAEASPDEVYRNAVAELEKGNFTKAQYLAESLTKKTPPHLSAEVFQIIGHARYKQKDLGRAALWYQRAQLLDGRDPELRQNLQHVYDLTYYLSFNQDSPLKEASFRLTLNQWLMLAAAGFWMFCLPLAWRVLTGRPTVWPFLVSALGLFILVPASAFAAIRPPSEERVKDISIVNQPDISAYTAATFTSSTVISLPPGSQVRVLEKRGSWVYAEIPAKDVTLRGWVETGALTPLWIWDEKLVP
jgi:BatD DUF11 like domain